MRWLAIAPALSTFIIQEPLCASRRLHGAVGVEGWGHLQVDGCCMLALKHVA